MFWKCSDGSGSPRDTEPKTNTHFLHNHYDSRYHLLMTSHSMSYLIWERLIIATGNGRNIEMAPVWHVETSHHRAKAKAVIGRMTVNMKGFVIST